jgi:hypothetical protein
MSEPFENIVVVRFDRENANQDQEKPRMFDLQFRLSRNAPEEWVQIARRAIGLMGGNGAVYHDRIVYRCTAQQAHEAEQAKILSELDKAIQDQK